MSEEKLFSEKQVSRGGDGDKFREALDQAEDDSEQPIRHGFWSEMKVQEVPVKASAATNGQTAASPRSSVLMRMASSTGDTKTFPSPILPVRAEATMAATTLAT